MSAPVQTLIFAEDPGAANFLAELPQALAAKNISSKIAASGLAVEYFRNRQIQCDIANNSVASALLEQIQPKIIVTGTSENPNSIGLQLIQLGKKRNIITIGVVDMEVNADRRFQGMGNSPFSFAPDRIIVPDSNTKLAFEKLGYPNSQIAVCGYPHFDFVQAKVKEYSAIDILEFRKRVISSAPPNKPIIVFIAEPASILNPGLSRKTDEYTLQGRSQSEFRTAIVLEEFLDALSNKPNRPYIVLRLHPKNAVDEFAAYTNEIDFVSNGGNPLEVLWAADLVVGMSSMLLQEAAWLEKNTLSILPTASEHLRLTSIANGLIPYVTTREELRKALESFAVGKFTRNNPNNYYAPGAMNRMVQFIADLLHQ
jgi:hypothetical protein